MRRRARIALLALVSVAAGCFLADERDGVRGYPGDWEDDDDDTNPYAVCSVVWEAHVSAGYGHRAWMTADVPQLASGEFVIDGVSASAGFLYGVTSTGHQAAYVSTGGIVMLPSPRTDLYSLAELVVSSGSWTLVEGTGASIAGGTGYAEVVWNGPYDCFGPGGLADCTLGLGSMTLSIGTATLSLGDDDGATFGYCAYSTTRSP